MGGRDLEIGGSCSVREGGKEQTGAATFLAKLYGYWLLRVSMAMDDGNNPFSVLVTYSPEGAVVLDALVLYLICLYPMGSAISNCGFG